MSGTVLTEEIRAREQAESARSLSEAEHTDTLRIPAGQLARYLAPPRTTAYPLEYCFHLLGDVRDRQVVDFGCGSGANAVVLARRGARVLGFDISHALVRLAQSRLLQHDASPAGLFVASAHDLPLPTASVDIIFGIAILHHLNIPLVRDEVLRVLRPGGRAIFQEPFRESALLRRVRPWLPWRDPDVSPYEQPLRRLDLEVLAQGFSSYADRGFVLPHVTLAERLALPDGVVRWCYELDRRLLAALPRLSRYASIRVVELRK